MDIFRFMNPGARTLMEQGAIVEGISSKTWIERYREPSEFKLEAPISSGLQAKLPLGCYISHIDSTEIMKVEDHEIVQDPGKEPMVSVTGRGVETITDERVMGMPATFPTSAIPTPLELTNVSVETLLVMYSLAYLVADPVRNIPYLEITSEDLPTEVIPEITVQRVTLYDHLMTVMEVFDLGLKSIRPTGSLINNRFHFHAGKDRTQEVFFSLDTNDVVSATYLWSLKQMKNVAYVYGKWVQTQVDQSGSTHGADKRIMVINASNIDEDFESAPSGSNRTRIINAMNARGRSLLARQNKTALAKVELNKERQSAKYRVDYEVGDLVTVVGGFDQTTKKRITEVAEIEDRNGLTIFPTLADIPVVEPGNLGNN